MQQLREVGWSQAAELVKVVRKDGDDFDRATWLHEAKAMPKRTSKVKSRSISPENRLRLGRPSISSFTSVSYQLLRKPSKTAGTYARY